MVDNASKLETAKHFLLSDDVKISKTNKDHILRFIRQISAEGISKSRQIKYIYYLKRLAEMLKKDFSQADRNDIIELLDKIENSNVKNGKRKGKPLSEWAKHDLKVTIKRFYKWLRETEGQEFGQGEYPNEVKWFSVNVKRERKKLPKDLLRTQDIEKLMDAAANTRDKCFIHLLYESGCRIGELLSLTLRNIEFDRYGVRILVNGKTGERKIRIIDSEPLLRIWIREHPTKNTIDNFLFCGLKGQTIEYDYYRLLLHKLAKKAGVKKPVNPHHFRHSRATELANYLTEAQLCKYMGWVQGSQEAATYVHLSGRDTDNAILRIYGKKKEQDINVKKEPITCPRCKTINDPLSRECINCTMALDRKTIMDYDQQKEQAMATGFATQEMLKDQKFKEFYMEMLAATWEKYKEMKDKI